MQRLTVKTTEFTLFFPLLEWFGVIFIRQGLYQGGVFRFTLYVPDNYPDCDCPVRDLVFFKFYVAFTVMNMMNKTKT